MFFVLFCAVLLSNLPTFYLFELVLNPTAEATSNSTIQVSWTATDNKDHIYRVEAKTPKDNITRAVVITTGLTANITNLVPFENYKIFITTLVPTGQNETVIIKKLIQTWPGIGVPPFDFQQRQLTPVTISMNWRASTKPLGKVKSYLVCYTTKGMETPICVTTKSTHSDSKNLKPYTYYTFTVQTANIMHDPKELIYGEYNNSVTEKTWPSDGEPPSVVSASSINSTTVIVHWEPPIESLGIICQFKLCYIANNVSAIEKCEILEYGNWSAIITNLQPLTAYNISMFTNNLFDNGQIGVFGYGFTTTNATTSPAAGAPPIYVYINVSSLSSCSVIWSPPLSEENFGEIANFKAILYREGKPYSHTVLSVNINSYNFIDLPLNYTYTVEVFTVNHPDINGHGGGLGMGASGVGSCKTKQLLLPEPGASPVTEIVLGVLGAVIAVMIIVIIILFVRK